MILRIGDGNDHDQESLSEAIAAAVLAGAVALAILPNAIEADVVKQPLLVCGAAVLIGLSLTMAFLRRHIIVVRTPVDLLLLAFLLLMLVRTIHAPEFRNARDAALLWGAFGAMFFAGSHLFGSLRSTRVLSLSIVCVVAAGELLAGAGLLWPGMPFVEFAAGADSRAASTLGSSSLFAAFLAGMLPVLYAEWKRQDGAWKILPSALIAGAIALLLAAGARGGLIAALVASGIYVALTVRRRKKGFVVLGLGVLAIAVIIFLVPSLHQRFFGMFSGTGTASLERRSVIWDAAWSAIRDSPFTGHGTGSFESIVPRFRTPEYWMNGSEDIVRHAHNELLELWSELGIVGPALWLSIVLLTLRRGMAVRRAPAGNLRDLVAALTAGFAAVLVENVAGVSLRNPAVGGYAWLFAGLIWRIAPGPERVRVRPVAVNAARPMALLPLLVSGIWGSVMMVQQTPLFRSERLALEARILESHNDHGAEDAYIAAYEACPWNPQAAMSAAGIYFRTGQPAKSLNALDAAQQRFPLYPRSNLLRGMVFASIGRYREADTCIRRELSVRSGPEGLHLQSILARAMDDTTVERHARVQLLQASMRTGRDFFVAESCARLAEIPGADSLEVAAIVRKARQQFAIAPPGKQQRRPPWGRTAP